MLSSPILNQPYYFARCLIKLDEGLKKLTAFCPLLVYSLNSCEVAENVTRAELKFNFYVCLLVAYLKSGSIRQRRETDFHKVIFFIVTFWA